MYPIITKNCLSHILHFKNINLIDDIKNYCNISTFRIELFDENAEKVKELIDKVFKMIN